MKKFILALLAAVTFVVHAADRQILNADGLPQRLPLTRELLNAAAIEQAVWYVVDTGPENDPRQKSWGEYFAPGATADEKYAYIEQQLIAGEGVEVPSADIAVQVKVTLYADIPSLSSVPVMSGGIKFHLIAGTNGSWVVPPHQRVQLSLESSIPLRIVGITSARFVSAYGGGYNMQVNASAGLLMYGPSILGEEGEIVITRFTEAHGTQSFAYNSRTGQLQPHIGNTQVGIAGLAMDAIEFVTGQVNRADYQAENNRACKYHTMKDVNGNKVFGPTLRFHSQMTLSNGEVRQAQVMKVYYARDLRAGNVIEHVFIPASPEGNDGWFEVSVGTGEPFYYFFEGDGWPGLIESYGPTKGGG